LNPKPQPYASILIQGASGSGKTHTCGTLIEDGYKPLFIVCNESELDTLIGSMKIAHEKVSYVKLDEFGQLYEVYEYLLQSKEFDSFVLDGLTELQQLAKDKIVGGTAEDFMVGKAIFADIKRAGKNAIREWNVVLEMMRHAVNPFLRLPMHRVMTALTKAEDDPFNPEDTIMMPALQGQFASIISMYFSYVGYCHKEIVGGQVKYCLTSTPFRRIETKDRFGLNAVMINPRLSNVIKAITDPSFKYQLTAEEEQLRSRLATLKPKSQEVKFG